MQADLGAVTGAQAAIHKRAKVTLDQVLPLLDGLTALNDPDDEDVQAVAPLPEQKPQSPGGATSVSAFHEYEL